MLKCTGCKTAYTLESKKCVNSCENLGQGACNHILEKILPDEFSFDIRTVLDVAQNSINPYLLFRKFFYSYYLAKILKVDYQQLATEINCSLEKIGEPGFEMTPLLVKDNIPGIFGRTLIKNETCNVSGSHKARHLMGNVIYLEVLNRAGIIQKKPKLAIYSCGNAALGAAAVAKAAGYKLDVFIPTNVNPRIIQKLKYYDANVVECPRIPGESGDPCYNRFQEALASGSFPFSCSGPDNWANIEGGQSLCLELMAQASLIKQKIDAIVIQVGGGALASSAAKTLEELYLADSIDIIPAVYTVQTEGGYPLVRAYLIMLKEIAIKNRLNCSLNINHSAEPAVKNKIFLEYLNNNLNEILRIAEFTKANYTIDKIQDALKDGSQNMRKYMWAWEEEPHSIAHGILDDITYDWFKVMQGMLRTGGVPVTVTEQELQKANILAKDVTKINVDYTGSSGFAGYIKLKKLEVIPKAASAAVIFTGIER